MSTGRRWFGGDPTVTRRRLLAAGAGGAIACAATGFELVRHGVLPGGHLLDRLEGACSVAPAAESFSAPGPTVTGRFFSRARNRIVAFTLAYPPGHGPGSRLPLAVYLYGDGGSHASPLGGLPLATALAGRTAAGVLPPMALAAADGGSLYWNPHPGDDPMAMLTRELIPMCRRRGLGTARGGVGAIGISMGGYGALLLAEKHPGLISAVAAISPAIWTSYDQARTVNAHAFAGRADFIADDVVTHASALRDTPVLIASGASDPFHPGVVALAGRLGPRAVVEVTAGCHDGSFFRRQQGPALAFIAHHLDASV